MIRCQECGRTVVGYFDHITVPDCPNKPDEEILAQMEAEEPGYGDKLAKLERGESIDEA